MKYQDKDVRDILIYNFFEQTTTVVKTFKKNDGMISHVKFLKKAQGGGDFIFFVRDTQFIEKLNIQSGETELIGKTADSVIAFNVNYNKLRDRDLQFKKENAGNIANDLESGMNDNDFTVVCLDESQNLTLFQQSQNLQKLQFKLHEA